MQLPSFLSSVNPVVAGAISLWLLGVSSFLLRRLPLRIWKFVKSRFVVSVAVPGVSDAGLLVVTSVLEWYMASPNAKSLRLFCLEPSVSDRISSRKYSATPTLSGNVTLSPGYATNFFLYKSRLGWFSRVKGSGTSSTLGAQEVILSFIGRDQTIIYDFLKEIEPKKELNSVEVYLFSSAKYSRGEWTLIKNRKNRSIDSVVIEHTIKTKLMENISFFYANKEWYDTRGIIYKLTYLLHGAPGTGKSSLIFALASYFERPIFMININTMGEEGFFNAMNSIPRNAFIVFEDMDVNEATLNREEEQDGKEPVQPPKRSNLSMSTLLNTLDGIASLDSNIVFITTNHIDKLDPALTRRGRIDHIVEINPLKDHEVREYIRLMYPDSEQDTGVVYADITGAELQASFLEHKEDFDAFVKAIPQQLNP